MTPTPHPDLTPLGNQLQDAEFMAYGTEAILLFAVVRDEMLRLPYFLDYYRQQGVSRFFIVSHSSTDGTDNYLVQQPDVAVFRTDGDYPANNSGITWLNQLHDAFGMGHWTLLVDADELFIYPGSDTRTLPELCRWLDAGGYEGMYALMLDMYGNSPIADLTYKAGDDFLSACSYFDRDYVKLPRLGAPFLARPFPTYEYIGGPRHRLCYRDEAHTGYMTRLAVKLWAQVMDMAHHKGVLKDVRKPAIPPLAYKMPLAKWKPGMHYVNSHRTAPLKLAVMTGAVLHFKYFQDFAARVDFAIKAGTHYDGGAEYKRYARMIAHDPAMSFMYGGSVEFKDSDTLMQLGLMQSEVGWPD